MGKIKQIKLFSDEECQTFDIKIKNIDLNFDASLGEDFDIINFNINPFYKRKNEKENN